MPRKDLLTGYAKVANCLYPTLASSKSPDSSKGTRYFRLIVQLFDAFEYYGANAEGEEQLLNKTVNNFHKAHPSVFQLIGEVLWREHIQSSRHEFAKWRKRSGPPKEPPAIWCPSSNSVYCPSHDFDSMMRGWTDPEDDTTG
jgi:hypothetical protein